MYVIRSPLAVIVVGRSFVCRADADLYAAAAPSSERTHSVNAKGRLTRHTTAKTTRPINPVRRQNCRQSKIDKSSYKSAFRIAGATTVPYSSMQCMTASCGIEPTVN